MSHSRLSDRALLIASGNAIQSLGNAALGIFLARFLADAAELGAYKQVWLVIHTFVPLFLLGIPHALYFYVPGLDARELRRFLLHGFALVGFAGLVFSAAMFLFPEAIARGLGNAEVAPLIRAFSPYPAFTLFSMLVFPLLVATGRHVRATIVNLGFFLPQSALIVLLAWRGVELEPLFRWLVLLAALRFLEATYEVARIVRLERGRVGIRPMPAWGELFGYSIPVGLSTLVNVLGQKLDRFVVSAALGASQFGVYALGSVEFPGIVLVSVATNTVMRPQVARLHHEARRDEIVRLFREAFRKQSLVVVPMAAFLVVYARPFVELLYTEEFTAATPIFQAYLAVALFRTANHSLLLTSTGRTREVLWATLAFLALNLAGNLLLVGPLGMLGPPLATVAALGALGAYFWIASARALGVPAGRLLPTGAVVRPALLSAGSVLLPWVLLPDGWGNLAVLAAAGSLFSLLYLVLALVTRSLTPGDRQLLLRWLRLGRTRG